MSEPGPPLLEAYYLPRTLCLNLSYLVAGTSVITGSFLPKSVPGKQCKQWEWEVLGGRGGGTDQRRENRLVTGGSGFESQLILPPG